MNQLITILLLVSTALVTQAQYPYNRELYQRHRPRNIVQTVAVPNLPEVSIPAALPVAAPVPSGPIPSIPQAPAEILNIAENSSSIAQLVRAQWNTILPKIILESQHEQTSALIQEMVDVNPCVDSLDAYVEFLEQRVQMIEQFGPEIDATVQKALSLRGEKNLGVILGTASDILNTLDTISYGFVKSFRCQAVADVGVDAIRDLALNLNRYNYTMIRA